MTVPLRLLAKEDPEAVKVIRQQLRADGVEVLTNCRVEEVLHDSMHGYVITCSQAGSDATSKLNFDALLVAAGESWLQKFTIFHNRSFNVALVCCGPQFGLSYPLRIRCCRTEDA